jgi:hypothetical protein
MLLLVPALLLSLTVVALARAEIVQKGHTRVVFQGEFSPQVLPRSGLAPIRVALGGDIVGTGGAVPRQLRQVTVEINRHGHLDPTGLPVCHVEQIQPATTAGALEACRGSLVGEGRFSAEVFLPEQAPFPSRGEIFAFNGTFRGSPAILAHVYGTQPAPTSYTLPFQITRTGGVYGTMLRASLPAATSEWGYVTGLSLTLDRTLSHRGKRRGYLSATCPAPPGFTAAVFPLARSSFAFDGGVKLSASLVRRCKVRA